MSTAERPADRTDELAFWLAQARAPRTRLARPRPRTVDLALPATGLAATGLTAVWGLLRLIGA